jgi:hypothetical protein
LRLGGTQREPRGAGIAGEGRDDPVERIRRNLEREDDEERYEQRGGDGRDGVRERRALCRASSRAGDTP